MLGFVQSRRMICAIRKRSKMNKQWFIIFVLLVSLVIASGPGVAQTRAAPPPASALSKVEGPALPVSGVAEGLAPSIVEGNAAKEQSLSPCVSADWWATVQEDIRRSEYHVTWQDHTHLPNLPAAYQAPNRAHNLRTYFTLAGIRAIPRTESEPS